MCQQQQFQIIGQCAASGGLHRHVREYGRLMLLFMKLYYENRVIAAQNFILDFRLQAWEVVLVYFRIQIFLMRFSRGFPVSECWPRR